MKTSFYLFFLLFVLALAAPCQSKTGVALNEFNPLIPDNIADPSVVMFNDTFYLYGTTDIDKGLQRMGPPVVWKSADFVNWHFEGTLQLTPAIDWEKPYRFRDNKGVEKTGYFRYWAPGNVVKHNNQYILYATIVKPDEKMGTYALVANRPEGPFRFSNGAGLFFPDSLLTQPESKPVVDDIDGDPFIDDDGNGYIFWRRRLAAALTPDLLSRAGSVVNIPTRHAGYSEGPGMFKRNGIYYYFYTLSANASYCNAYMISRKGPLGPFDTPPGKNVFVFSNPGQNVWGPGHGNVFHLPGSDRYFFVYLEYGEGGTTRQVFANEMFFNPDGTLQPVNVNRIGIGALGKAKKTRRLIKPVVATASSRREPKNTTANIAPDPDTVAAAAQANRPVPQRVQRTFSYEAGNAVDGSNGTRWWAGESDNDRWLQLDLGKQKKVGSMEVNFVFPVFGHSFALESSRDGIRWNSVQVPAEGQVRSPHVVSKIGKTRYLRLKIISGTPAIWEIRLYE